jgi:hypothetical protein
MEDTKMPIIGNPWAQDAGRFGQGVGDSLSQALLQLPQQRYMMALQQAQMAQRQQQMAQNYGLQQQKAQEMGQYHSNELGLRQQQVGIDKQRADDQWVANRNRMLAEIHANNFRMQQAQKPTVQDNMIIQPNVPQQSQDGLQQTNQPPQQPWSVTPVPQTQGGGGSSSSGTATALGDVSSIIKGMLANPGLQTNYPSIWQQSTNAYPQMLQRFMQQPQPFPQMGQTNQPGMMQSNSIPPWASQQLPDGSFNFAP